MASNSPNLGLPMLQAAQGQKHVTHNEALTVLDGLVQLSVRSRSSSVPPVSPLEGDRYLVAGEGSGDWAGRGASVAIWHQETWRFHAPLAGWLTWVDDENRLLVHDGAGWRDLPGVFGSLGVNAVADETNRLVVGGSASLFDGGSGGHSIKLNKAVPGNLANVIWQTGYSGRAELGLLGSDDWQLKVSDDGDAWIEALTVSRSNGHVGIGKVPGPVRLEVSGSLRMTSSVAAFLQLMNTGPSGAQAWIGIPDWNRTAFYMYGSATDIMTMYDTPTRSHRLYGGGSERIRIASGGEVGIGTSSPTARLHVAGPVRTGSYLKAALPSAATVGAGTLAYVQDAAGGAQFAYSDGTQWLKMRDGNPV